MDFLNNLEKKMNEKNLNKSQLAKGMGVAPSTVNSWFNRSAENITLKTLKKHSTNIGIYHRRPRTIF